MYTCIVVPNGSTSLQGIMKAIARFYGVDWNTLSASGDGYSFWRVYNPLGEQLAQVDYVELD